MPTKMMFHRRRRTGSVRSTNSITSTDELTSWLDDDVCTTCGTAVQAGQLFCSQQCRQEDAQANINHGGFDAAVFDAELASTSAPAHSNRRHSAKPPPRVSSGDALAVAERQRQLNNGKNAGGAQETNTEVKFRYACPPSPSILAKYGGSATTATTVAPTGHLTSPALAALDRRSPAMQQQTSSTSGKAPRSNSERDWMSSSSEESNIPTREATSQRRSSSRSTFSSASEAAFSTDQSTPSPAGRSTIDEMDDLDTVTDLSLPPSVHPAATVMLNASAASHRSPAQKTVPLPGGQPSSRRDSMAAMSYARRPSRTNLPAPVMFTSPVLNTTKTAAKTKSPRGSFGEHGSVSGSHSNSNSRYDVPSLATLRKYVEASTRQSPELKRSSVSAMPVLGGSERHVAKMANEHAVRKSPPSPPQAASASSSAGKTMRAFSPTTLKSATTTATSSATLASIPSKHHHSPTPEVGFVCGRFGCQGVSSSSPESVKTLAEPLQTKVSVLSSQDRRGSMSLAHKHTHSAAAGLSLLASSDANKSHVKDSHAATKKLTMTPLSKATKVLSPTEADQAGDASDTLARLVKSPPRGRSHARGRSSTSRRSPSPPRGVARRGRSEDMLSSKGGDLAYVSPRSQPIAVSRVSPHYDFDAVHDADDEDEEKREPSRRGRSPTERGRASVRSLRSLAPVAPLDGKHAQAIAHEEDPRKADVDVATKVNAGGYDEVDLDEL